MKKWRARLLEGDPIGYTDVYLDTEVEAALAAKDEEIGRLKAAFDSACATIDIRDEQLAAARAEVERLKEALDGMLHQFAYPVPGPKLTTGGLSTLELAFEVMGWDDPQPTPERKCDEPGCTEHSTCGWPAKGGPYRRTCYDHMEKQP